MDLNDDDESFGIQRMPHNRRPTWSYAESFVHLETRAESYGNSIAGRMVLFKATVLFI